jgi:hypothetical protein
MFAAGTCGSAVVCCPEPARVKRAGWRTPRLSAAQRARFASDTSGARVVMPPTAAGAGATG